MSDEEEPVPAFDANHYPDGVNANFKTDDAEGLRTKYAGQESGIHSGGVHKIHHIFGCGTFLSPIHQICT
jgi:hypothetical protein